MSGTSSTDPVECVHCHAENPAEALYCGQCGRRLPPPFEYRNWDAPGAPQTATPPFWQRWVQYAEPRREGGISQCSNCGRDNPDYSRFCIYCGSELGPQLGSGGHENLGTQTGSTPSAEREQPTADRKASDAWAEHSQHPSPGSAGGAEVSEGEIDRRAPTETRPAGAERTTGGFDTLGTPEHGEGIKKDEEVSPPPLRQAQGRLYPPPPEGEGESIAPTRSAGSGQALSSPSPGEGLRPLSVRQIVDSAFEVYRRHFVLFLVAGSILSVPAAVALPADPIGQGIRVVADLLTGAALIRLASDALLGEQPHFGSAYRAALGRLGWLLWTDLLFALAVGGLCVAGVLSLPGRAGTRRSVRQRCCSGRRRSAPAWCERG